LQLLSHPLRRLAHPRSQTGHAEPSSHTLTFKSWPARRLNRAGRLLLTLLVGACRSEPPSDAALTRQFEDNATHYAAVITMLSQDPKVGTIGPGFLFRVDKPFEDADVRQLGITDHRLTEYKRLLALTGTVRLDRYGREAVSFGTWATGFAGHTQHRGIAWLASPPGAGGGRRFSHIRGKWYLYDD
jgi:hypothetical protein